MGLIQLHPYPSGTKGPSEYRRTGLFDYTAMRLPVHHFVPPSPTQLGTFSSNHQRHRFGHAPHNFIVLDPLFNIGCFIFYDYRNRNPVQFRISFTISL